MVFPTGGPLARHPSQLYEAFFEGLVLFVILLWFIKPDLFVPGETYLPVAWDYSDLEEVVTPYLADESARRRIADTARQRLREALSEDWFIARFQKVMGQAGVL